MPSGKYLEKAIEVESGYSPLVWRCVRIRIIIEDAGVVVYLDLDGWKDVTACMTGKAPTGAKTVTILNAESMPEYATVFGVFLTKILADPVFVGAELKDLPVA
jgi:hypothetical protein